MDDKPIRLEPTEQQIAELLLQGCDNSEIARQLHMARRTVKAHFNRLFLTIWNFRRYQASQARNFTLSEAVMFADQRYGNRIPSEREQRVIELVAQGLKNREFAAASAPPNTSSKTTFESSMTSSDSGTGSNWHSGTKRDAGIPAHA